ncbi:YheU family protein [Endozoicomonas sp. SCSIO W0465]|uniref:YheU family protein n=1 Tax=Endozoicomonas sp. SCSIO W0465 TaxID=2918516 RepID=UPI002075A179|nr:YheU family protein [Endozoicomonas sp. SCSIO W0465]USE38620.1 YheU family protein [Endozoicomonas sp. SCSIO W0465]
MIIPHEMLAPETLNNLIEEFVSREGTDNGYDDTLPEKVEQVLHLLKSGELVIVFDPVTQTPNMMSTESAHRVLTDND